MTTLLFAFLLAGGLALFMVPLAGRLGRALGALDQPNTRKLLSSAIPRTGGLGIFFAHILSLFLIALLGTRVSALLDLNTDFRFLWIGAVIILALGLWDDFRPLSARVKLPVQILAASVAFAGGIAIEPGVLQGFLGLTSPLISYSLTIFWFVLLINAVNLVDGLDALAGGITFFVCLVLAILQVLGEDYLLAMYFITLAGSIGGFLRYNFNPASVFMGDGGSYYLGYMIAGLSILGSLKSQVGVTLTVPFLAMGVPVFDALFAPVRRFLTGKKIFQPDSGHLHHNLLALGLTSRRTVFILYAVTAALCGLALILVNVYDEETGLLLILICAGVFAALHCHGYFRYMDREKLGSWFRDMGFITGLHRDRRRFLDLQMRISRCQGPDELWAVLSKGLDILDFDYAEMRLFLNEKQNSTSWSWSRSSHQPELQESGLFKLELPLQCKEGKSFGELWLIKDLRRSLLTHYTLTRVEHLRRAVLRCLLSWQPNQHHPGPRI
jgi:UDP-GlcNAc:undecaprenyl-phosphate GlcNAc-1-phosphate transferase